MLDFVTAREPEEKRQLTLCCASSGRDLRTCSCSRYRATEGSLARTYMLSVNLSVTATKKPQWLWKVGNDGEKRGLEKVSWSCLQHN